MATPALRYIFTLLFGIAAVTCQATEYEVPAGTDVGVFFRDLPEDATAVFFSASAKYSSQGDIPLPDRRLLVIDGKGCELHLGPNSNGFTRAVKDQDEAMFKMASRYAIRDFGMIQGGLKGIDLKATLGSTITNCRLTGQTEVGIDLSFCLMARLQNVLVTNPRNKGFVLRDGDWPGATPINSQSNSSVLEQCRVFCTTTTTDAFTILNTGGVRMVDCVSEGAEADRDIYLSAVTSDEEDRIANNPAVRSFTLQNFHVEHALRKESILVNMPAQAVVHLSNVYWNFGQTAPVIRYVRGQLNLTEIPWWMNNFVIATRVNSPRISVSHSHSKLQLGAQNERTKLKAGSFELLDPLPGNEVLVTKFITISDPAY
ncbi:MAG: hypothetical protein KBA60_02005 [Flavobacteriales bacterium]|nr:hypothetical protein [Flavobacteriales bacterium]MBP6641482.1 hypothetical protein [Flavobacteriales bacterium]MBP7154755.1 hypothetical protein [Flavobacteriales bacterium]HQV73945.1 hypothetical protein [Flavobacteriales bacterium]HQW39614.1 hypothetical protein [Flavobacteriales bacterium]